MKKSLFFTLILLFLMILQNYGQIAAGYQTDGNTLCISTNPIKKIFGEFRINTKSYNQAPVLYTDRGIAQAYVLITLFSSEYTSIYSGGGMGINILSEESDKWLSLNIPVGIRINPFPRLPDLFLTGEYDPMIITDGDFPIVHSMSVGFRYIISKKKE